MVASRKYILDVLNREAGLGQRYSLRRFLALRFRQVRSLYDNFGENASRIQLRDVKSLVSLLSIVTKRRAVALLLQGTPGNHKYGVDGVLIHSLSPPLYSRYHSFSLSPQSPSQRQGLKGTGGGPRCIKVTMP